MSWRRSEILGSALLSLAAQPVSIQADHGTKARSCVRIDHRRRPSSRTPDGDIWKRAPRALIVPERNRFQAKATRRRWFASKPLKTVVFKAFGDGQLQPTPRVITSGGSGTKGLWRDDGPCPPAGGAGQ